MLYYNISFDTICHSILQMIQEFCSLTGRKEGARWKEVETKVLKFTALDVRQAVRSLLLHHDLHHDAAEEKNEG